MKKRMFAALFVALCAGVPMAYAGSINGMQQEAVCDPFVNHGNNCAKPNGDGSINVDADAVSDGAVRTDSASSAAVGASFSTVGYGSVSFQFISDGGGNTIVVEGSNDGGTTWRLIALQDTSSTTVGASTTVAPGSSGFTVVPTYVMPMMRWRVSVYVSGTTTIATGLKRDVVLNLPTVFVGNTPAVSPNIFPSGAVAISASATGTTAATTATLAAASGKTTYICGMSIRANATSSATGDATVTGTITGTLHFTQWTAALASGIGLVEENFSHCVPGSATNTGIAVISAAPGSGGVVSVSAWGFQQ